MRASTIIFLIFCGWFVIFKMFPVRPVDLSVNFCGTIDEDPTQRYSGIPQNEQQVRGKQAFQANCARCHNSRLDKNGTGPALMGISSRIPGGDWIYRWVANSSKMVQEGDAYAVKVYNENGKINMDPFPSLPKETIDDILTWIDGYYPYEIQY